MKWLPLSILWLVSGCAIAPLELDPALETELAEMIQGVSVDSPDLVLLALSESSSEEILAQINRDWSDTYKVQRLSRLFFDSDQKNIQYDAWSTGTAEETFVSGRGNCLAMSSLFVSAARLLRFDARFQTVQVTPRWTHEGSTLIRYEHIVATGSVGQRNYVIDFMPEFSGESEDTRIISDEQALALYYSNLAVESLVAGDMDEARRKSLQGLKLWRENSNIWSNLGTVFRRQGQVRLAEASYRQALVYQRQNYTALANLTQLYLLEGRDEEAEQYLRTVSRYYRRNPYYYLQFARMQLETGDLSGASQSLNRAVSLERNDPLLFDELARVYEQLEDSASSNAANVRAERIRKKQKARQLREQDLIRPGA